MQAAPFVMTTTMVYRRHSCSKVGTVIQDTSIYDVYVVVGMIVMVGWFMGSYVYENLVIVPPPLNDGSVKRRWHK